MKLKMESETRGKTPAITLFGKRSYLHRSAHDTKAIDFVATARGADYLNPLSIALRIWYSSSLSGIESA